MRVCGCYDPGMPEHSPDFLAVFWPLLAVAFVMIRTWVAANPKPRPRLARWSVAGAVVCFLAIAEMLVCHFLLNGCPGSPWPYLIGVAGAFAAALVALWPDAKSGMGVVAGRITKSRRRKPKSGPAAPAKSHPSAAIPRTPVGEILRDLVAAHGQDRARTIVAEAAIERHKPNSPSSTGTSAAPHVVRSRIRGSSGQARRHLELLEEKEFAELKGMADLRTKEERADALQRFTEIVSELVETIEQRRGAGGMRDRDWQTVATLYERANEALTGVPLNKHREYAEDLAKIRGMMERREEPGRPPHPFMLRDLRDRLDRDLRG